MCINKNPEEFIRFKTLRKDWEKNKISIKSLIIVFSFRAAGYFANHPVLAIRVIGMPIRALYKFLVEFIIGAELPDRVKAGPGLAVYHGVGLVVNSGTVLGENVTLRQNTTIGAKTENGQAPTICDNVNIGANVVIIGNITIGAGSLIGAGAIVVETCPPCSTVHSQKALIHSSEKFLIN